jgi:hypothetical protein
MTKRYSETDITNINAAIDTFVTAKATPSSWFGTKAAAGAPWSGTITAARRMHAGLNSNPPDNLTPQSVVEGWTAAVNRLGGIING